MWTTKLSTAFKEEYQENDIVYRKAKDKKQAMNREAENLREDGLLRIGKFLSVKAITEDTFTSLDVARECDVPVSAVAQILSCLSGSVYHTEEGLKKKGTFDVINQTANIFTYYPHFELFKKVEFTGQLYREKRIAELDENNNILSIHTRKSSEPVKIYKVTLTRVKEKED